MVSVTIWLGLVVPTDCTPKARLEGARVARPQVGALKLEMRVFQMVWVPVWFAVKYSFTYQKAHSPTGSTVHRPPAAPRMRWLWLD